MHNKPQSSASLQPPVLQKRKGHQIVTFLTVRDLLNFDFFHNYKLNESLCCTSVHTDFTVPLFTNFSHKANANYSDRKTGGKNKGIQANTHIFLVSCHGWKRATAPGLSQSYWHNKGAPGPAAQSKICGCRQQNGERDKKEERKGSNTPSCCELFTLQSFHCKEKCYWEKVQGTKMLGGKQANTALAVRGPGLLQTQKSISKPDPGRGSYFRLMKQPLPWQTWSLFCCRQPAGAHLHSAATARWIVHSALLCAPSCSGSPQNCIYLLLKEEGNWMGSENASAGQEGMSAGQPWLQLSTLSEDFRLAGSRQKPVLAIVLRNCQL